jgi:hypothetical protein
VITWNDRSREERSLLNPAFCSILLWHAARGREVGGSGTLSLEEAFVVLALVLPASTREVLPSAVSTSLAVWLAEYPIEQRRLPQRARALLPFSRAALIFGTLQGLLQLDGTKIRPRLNSAKRIQTVLSTSSDEVRMCAKKAEFIGRWFAKVGTPSTILALLGVRP